MKFYCPTCGFGNTQKNSCVKCQKPIKGQIAATVVTKPAVTIAQIDEDEDSEIQVEETVPRIKKLKLNVASSRPQALTLGSVIGTASPDESTGTSRANKHVDVNKFMEDRKKWISSRNNLEA